LFEIAVPRRDVAFVPWAVPIDWIMPPDLWPLLTGCEGTYCALGQRGPP